LKSNRTDLAPWDYIIRDINGVVLLILGTKARKLGLQLTRLVSSKFALFGHFSLKYFPDLVKQSAHPFSVTLSLQGKGIFSKSFLHEQFLGYLIHIHKHPKMSKSAKNATIKTEDPTKLFTLLEKLGEG
jgi:hypothetical protein